jgi:pimeloyl-CoA synthetase
MKVMRGRLQFLFNRHTKEKEQPNFLRVQVQKIKEQGRTFVQVNTDRPLELGTKKEAR